METTTAVSVGERWNKGKLVAYLVVGEHHWRNEIFLAVWPRFYFS